MRALLQSFSLLAILLFTIGSSHGQTGILGADDAFTLSVERGSPGTIILHWKIATGYYLYREHLAVREMTYDAALPLNLPPGVRRSDRNFGTSEVYRDEVSVLVAPAEQTTLRVQYQGCKENSICYPPNSKRVDLTSLSISDQNMAKSSSDRISRATTQQSNLTYRLASDPGADLVQTLLDSEGPVWLISRFFFFGVLLAFNLCLLPMYPVVAATLARSSADLSLVRGFWLSCAYVMAMALALGLLGIAAALSGHNLQVVLQSPITVGAVAFILVCLGLSAFGLFDIELPHAWGNQISRLRSRYTGSAASTGLLGFTFTLVVGPCVTAPLAAALLYITETGNVALGATSLFALGLGQGIPLIALGSFGGRVLPRGGRWTIHIRHACGLFLIALAVWMFGRTLSDTVAASASAVALVLFGVLIGGFHDGAAGSRRPFLKAAGVVLILCGAAVVVATIREPFDKFRQLSKGVGGSAALDEFAEFASVSSPQEFNDELHRAFIDRKPTLIYATADGCLACKSVDRKLLNPSSVGRLARDLHLVKLDLTRPDERSETLMRDLKVLGPPTVIFFSASSNEISGSRLVGDFSTDAFLASARMAIRRGRN
ncbi:protein-disulfide reductase DsbD [Bradyrhizobium sp. 180]|uniref:protein-disulfide reductase DsbD n=1 Tax=Bradyrhizobium sp. 180 TaxID=2782650 RepID=UPI001FFBE0E3|nr:protein-disulfide reductase DsbD [Bradyrhizobium sp. 180]MCK1492166.1 protein-disulfide reductase DsbD [Bradyrhizobium sp. 180]